MDVDLDQCKKKLGMRSRSRFFTIPLESGKGAGFSYAGTGSQGLRLKGNAF